MSTNLKLLIEPHILYGVFGFYTNFKTFYSWVFFDKTTHIGEKELELSKICNLEYFWEAIFHFSFAESS